MTLYVGLLSAIPNDHDPEGEELKGRGYARQAARFGIDAPGIRPLGSVANTDLINFGPAREDWPLVVGYAVWDASTDGSVIRWASLVCPKGVSRDDRAHFAPGALVIEGLTGKLTHPGQAENYYGA